MRGANLSRACRGERRGNPETRQTDIFVDKRHALSYYKKMEENVFYDFSPEKNSKLKEERGISFEEVIAAIDEGYLLDVIEHYNKDKFPNQKVYIVEIDCYVYLVPFVRNEDEIFLKTIFPSRKLTKLYKHCIEGKTDDN